jgi:hypothetical protein
MRPGAALLLLLVAVAPPARAVSVRVLPDTAWIESGRGLQRVHVDFRFEHDGPDTLELADIVVSPTTSAGGSWPGASSAATARRPRSARSRPAP